MTLTSILVFTTFAILFRLLARPAGRGWLLFVASVLAVYWLQPSTPVRYLDFWFPTLTLALAVLGWVLTRPAPTRGAAPLTRDAGAANAPLTRGGAPLTRDAGVAADASLSSWRANLLTAGIIAGIVLLVGLTRYLDVSGLIIPSRPPAFEQVLAAVGVALLLALGLSRFHDRGILWGAIAVLVALLVVLKTPSLATAVSVGLRNLMNQSTALAAAGDLRWLGFSYVAFRIIHTLRERQNGRLPELTLQEYMVYAVFFPAFTAGPIDRSERFVKDLRKLTAENPEKAKRKLTAEDAENAERRDKTKKANSDTALGEDQKSEIIKNPSASSASSAVNFVARAVMPQVWPEWAGGAQRLTLGLLKKFVVADGLALVALNANNAAQASGAGWTWVLLYAYSLQIYFDFSGYTDIAIGLGRLLGISLPENFNAPYLKPNLTLFWNSWHMTLTNWFRAYYFNPVTRWLRTIKFSSIFSPLRGENIEENKSGIPPAAIIFFTQLSTFVLIGLWHGVTWNFVLWGAWHGLGLYVQNRWSEAMRPRYAALEERAAGDAGSAGAGRLQKGLGVVSTLLTFHYVALGWVFFALPDPGLSLRVLGKLFGG